MNPAYPMIYSCLQKKSFRFRNRAAEFLKAYTSNSLDRPHNAFVDIHGKIIATADQFLVSEQEFLVVIEASFEERLRLHLEKYLFLYGTEMEEASYKIHFDLDSSHPKTTGEIIIPQKAGQLILTQKKIISQVSEEEFLLFRVRNRIPLQ